MYQFVQVENSHPFPIIIQPSLIEMHTTMHYGNNGRFELGEKLIATNAEYS